MYVAKVSFILTLRRKEILDNHYYYTMTTQTSPGFLHVCNTNLSKTPWEKKKLLLTSNFSFSQCVLYSFGEHSAIFIKFKIAICKLSVLKKSLKFVVRERVKELEALERLYRSTGLIFLQWRKFFVMQWKTFREKAIF